MSAIGPSRTSRHVRSAAASGGYADIVNLPVHDLEPSSCFHLSRTLFIFIGRFFCIARFARRSRRSVGPQTNAHKIDVAPSLFGIDYELNTAAEIVPCHLQKAATAAFMADGVGHPSVPDSCSSSVMQMETTGRGTRFVTLIEDVQQPACRVGLKVDEAVEISHSVRARRSSGPA
jgi:hypothetical protein